MKELHPETRVFFERGEGSRGERREFYVEADALAAIQAGRYCKGWEIGFGLYTRAFPADPEKIKQLIEEAPLAGSAMHRQGVRDSWWRIAAEYLKQQKEEDNG